MIVGIDPGQTGAFALLDDNLELVDTYDMPTADKQVVAPMVAFWLGEMRAAYGIMQVVIEEVHAMPKQGVASSFKFGKNFGVVIGASAAHPQAFIRANRWKKHHRLTGKDKDAARLLAIQMWPGMAEEHFSQKAKGQARADAALLARAWAEAS